MKLIYLFLIFLGYAKAQKRCWAYKYSEAIAGNSTGLDRLCAVEDENATVHVQQCEPDSSFSCQPNKSIFGKTKCSEGTFKTKLRPSAPGDYCKSDSECSTYNCDK